jgi:hypothetical protein
MPNEAQAISGEPEYLPTTVTQEPKQILSIQYKMSKNLITLPDTDRDRQEKENEAACVIKDQLLPVA